MPNLSNANNSRLPIIPVRLLLLHCQCPGLHGDVLLRHSEHTFNELFSVVLMEVDKVSYALLQFQLFKGGNDLILAGIYALSSLAIQWFRCQGIGDVWFGVSLPLFSLLLLGNELAPLYSLWGMVVTIAAAPVIWRPSFLIVILQFGCLVTVKIGVAISSSSRLSLQVALVSIKWIAGLGLLPFRVNAQVASLYLYSKPQYSPQLSPGQFHHQKVYCVLLLITKIIN